MNWDFPYASRRMPAMARNVVATSQPLAAQAGLQMMQRGGNAIDAALAAAISDRGGAEYERYRLRCVRHPLGRRKAARAQRFRPVATGVDAISRSTTACRRADGMWSLCRGACRRGWCCRSDLAGCHSLTSSSRRFATRKMDGLCRQLRRRRGPWLSGLTPTCRTGTQPSGAMAACPP